MGMSRDGYKPVGERPDGKRVLKTVKMPDGREIEFEVFVVDSPEGDDPAPRQVQPKSPVGGFGWVRHHSV